MPYIFGPVPSRRLGFSLGVDVIPPKTCTLNCIYCQLGKTTNKTIQRKEYIPADKILKELDIKITQRKDQKIDYITFSGSGEPTLNTKLGYMIERIKKITSIPVAVITNGTLLHDQDLQEELSKADLAIPSLDAPDEETFKKINRPHHSITLEKAISGISSFSQKFQGKIWLEIMLIEGINDSPQQIKKFAEVVKRIRLEKIQLNTPVRPPAEEFVRPASLSSLKKAKSILGERCEIISGFKKFQQKTYTKDMESVMLAMIRRRPVSLGDISSSLGIHKNEAVKYVEVLERKRLIGSKRYGEEKYYYSL